MTEPIDEMARIASWFDRVGVIARDQNDVAIGRTMFAQCTSCYCLLQIDRDVLVKHYQYHVRPKKGK